MCGIIGVLGQDSSRKVFEGLQRLEYRGYDSWGVASIYEGNNPKVPKFYIEKKVGKISSDKDNYLFDFPDKIAIGHTRWATHGGVTKENAHPHMSMDNKIAIAHNGIVENYAELKQKLIEDGFKFKSETDSEVIAHLIEQFMTKDFGFEESFRRTLNQLEGNFAIVAIYLGNKNALYGARLGSPLILGKSPTHKFLGSDVTAIIPYTKEVSYLDDYDFVILDSTGIKVFDFRKNFSEGKKATKFQTIDWNIEQAKKGAFEHFMLKEIHEQPETILKTVMQPKSKLDEFLSMVTNSKKVYLVGSGSSYHACIAGTHFFGSISKLESRPVLASEFNAVQNFVDKDTLVIALSQSGETADLIDAIKSAKSKGAKVASIVNVMESTVMRLSDCTILMNAGPEICVLSTKSYTSQLAILLLLAHAIIGKAEECKKLIEETSGKLGDIIIKTEKIVKELIKNNKPILLNPKNNTIFVIGRGMSYPTALEAALKIKEVTYIHAEAFAGGELKHGAIALVEEGTPAIVFSDPETARLITSNAIEMKSRGAHIIMLDSNTVDSYDYSFGLDDFGIANPIVMIIPVQILAYYLALKLGRDVDHPKNLAKSVTVK